jgi:hypothetical protein
MLKESYYTAPREIDQLVFEKLVPPQHYRRQVKRVLDCERFRNQGKECYSPDLGRGAADPVRLSKLEFLQFHYTLSDRAVITQAGVNVAFGSGLALSLDSAVPGASLLAPWRTRLGEQRQQARGGHVVKQAREQGLVRERLRLQDATPGIANSAVPSTWALVAQARHRLLASARP